MAKSSSCTNHSETRSLSAVKPIVTSLYEGATELRIRISPKKDAGVDEETSVVRHVDSQGVVEFLVPKKEESADADDCAITLASSLLSFLLKDIESAKSMQKKVLQAEGISRARAEGKQLGRPKKELSEAYCKAIDLCRAGKLSVAEGAEYCGMTYCAFYKSMKRREHRAETGL